MGTRTLTWRPLAVGVDFSQGSRASGDQLYPFWGETQYVSQGIGRFSTSDRCPQYAPPMRKLLIGLLAMSLLASLSLASATAAPPPPPPVANIVACGGTGLVSEAVQAVACTTDAEAGATTWNHDYTEVKLQAKPKHDSPPEAAAGGWSSNGPLDVSGNEFCVTLKADPPGGHSDYAVIEVALSWDGEQQPTVTFPATHGNVSYCVGNVPVTAQNFFWEALGVTGAAEGDAKVKLKFVDVSFATVS